MSRICARRGAKLCQCELRVLEFAPARAAERVNAFHALDATRERAASTVGSNEVQSDLRPRGRRGLGAGVNQPCQVRFAVQRGHAARGAVQQPIPADRVPRGPLQQLRVAVHAARASVRAAQQGWEVAAARGERGRGLGGQAPPQPQTGEFNGCWGEAMPTEMRAAANRHAADLHPFQMALQRHTELRAGRVDAVMHADQ